MGGWAGAGLGTLKGFDRAAGANAAANDVQGVQDARIQNKQAAMQQQIAPLTQALQAERTRLALYANPEDPTKPLPGKETQYAASHDAMADIIGKMRTILHPPPSEDPHGLGYLGARALDKLHITRDLAGHMRTDQSNKVNDYYQKNNQAAGQEATTMAQATPYNPSPQMNKRKRPRLKRVLCPRRRPNRSDSSPNISKIIPARIRSRRFVRSRMQPTRPLLKMPNCCPRRE